MVMMMPPAVCPPSASAAAAACRSNVALVTRIAEPRLSSTRLKIDAALPGSPPTASLTAAVVAGVVGLAQLPVHGRPGVHVLDGRVELGADVVVGGRV